jgi:preprotein translocase subunit YajC
MYMNYFNLLLQGAPGGAGMQQLLMIVLIIVVFYFFMIRPQTKKAKDERVFRENINKGDKIVTIGGVHGKIVEIQERTLIIEVDTNVKLKIEKAAISADSSKQYKDKA